VIDDIVNPPPAPDACRLWHCLLFRSLPIPAPDCVRASTRPKGAEKSAQAPGPTDTVIVSKIPERKGPVTSLLKKLFLQEPRRCHGRIQFRGVVRCLKRIRAAFPSGSKRSHEGHQAA